MCGVIIELRNKDARAVSVHVRHAIVEVNVVIGVLVVHGELYVVTSRYQSRVDDGMKIERTTKMVNVLEEFARNHNIVLQ